MSPKDLDGIFFEDAFLHLRGSRPNHLDADTNLADSVRGADLPSQTAETPSTASWAAVIDGAVIEDEVKRVQAKLATAVATRSHFQGGGFRVARRYFHELAFLFGIIARHEDDVRWKRTAAAAGGLFAAAARETRVVTQQSFGVARDAHEALQELIRGGTITTSRSGGQEGWDDLADRSALMIRLEQALDETVAAVTANEEEFQRQPERLLHETQLVHAMARVLADGQMPDGDDEDYAAYCRQMMDAAARVGRAVRQQRYEEARAAAASVHQSCSDCHEDYRI